MFVDTLNDLPTTKRFGESYGSYPVLRVHDAEEKDLAGRIDGNPIAGRIPVKDVLSQLELGLREFESKKRK